MQPVEASYVVQVASFRKLGDADRLKANLALLGLEGHIQTVSINGEEIWHRVRVGPFDKLNQLNQARDHLNQNDYEAKVYKLGN